MCCLRLLSRKALIMIALAIYHYPCCYARMESSSDGCEDHLLHSAIKGEVYVEQPLGFEVQDQDTHVFWLKKTLCGLKLAPRDWYERIDSYLMKLGFTHSNANSNLYFKADRENPLILVLYVDDLFLTDVDPLIHQWKRELASNEGPRSDTSLPRPEGLAETWKDFPLSRETHCEASEKIWFGGL